MAFKNQKPKTIGSIYVNTKKGIDEDDLRQVRKAVKVLKEVGAFLSISLKNDDGDYDKYVGFFNGFKKEASQPDIMIYPSQGGGFSKKSKKRDEEEDDDFEEEENEEEEEAPKKKVKKATKKDEDDFDSDSVPF